MTRCYIKILSGHELSTNPSACLVLTPTTIVIFGCKSCCVQLILPVADMKLSRKNNLNNNTSIIAFFKLEKEETETILNQPPNFQQFFDSFNTASLSTRAEAVCEEMNQDSVVLEVELSKSSADFIMITFKNWKQQ